MNLKDISNPIEIKSYTIYNWFYKFNFEYKNIKKRNL